MLTHRRHKVTNEELVDRDVREALATALGERNRMLYWRLLFGFLFIAMVSTLFLYRQSEGQKHFREQIVSACHQNQHNARNFNALIDRLTDAYATSPVLTQRQRDERVAFFKGAKETVPQCPPRR